MTGVNPFDWYGGAFLALYAFLFVGALIGGGVIAAWLRPEGRPLPVIDEEELAVLAGGTTRLAETVLARLMARGAAIIDGSRLSFAASVAGGSPIEREIASLSSPAKWTTIRHRVALAAERIEGQLAGRGLLMEQREARQIGLYAAIPLLLLFGFGAIKLQLGLARERPVGFLGAFLVATVIAALIRVFATRRVTKAGRAALAEARERSARLKLAPTRDETGTAVALFGTAVLVGSPIAGLHRMRQSDGGGGGGGDGSSGCGGGGGGCGGCGGG